MPLLKFALGVFKKNMIMIVHKTVGITDKGIFYEGLIHLILEN